MRWLLAGVRNVVVFLVIFVAVDFAITHLRWTLGSPELQLNRNLLTLLLVAEYVVSGVIAFMATRSIFSRSRRSKTGDDKSPESVVSQSTPAQAVATHLEPEGPAPSDPIQEPASRIPEPNNRRASQSKRWIAAGAVVVAAVVVAGGLWAAVGEWLPLRGAQPPATGVNQSFWATLQKWQYLQARPDLDDGRWRLAEACDQLSQEWEVVAPLADDSQTQRAVPGFDAVAEEHNLRLLRREFARLEQRWRELRRHHMAGSLWLLEEETHLTRRAARFAAEQKAVASELRRHGRCSRESADRARRAAREFETALRDWESTGRAPANVRE